mgnify:FL=1
MPGKTLKTALNSEASNRTESALNFEIPAGDAPEWIELIPAGATITGRDGRRWVNDRPDGVIERFRADGRDIPVDFEHATELKAPKGEKAPAVAWITDLENRGGAVWGHVVWNQTGQDSVALREYRYYSPVWDYEIESGRIVRLVSVGLTNRPNLRVTALNHESSQEEKPMLKKLLKALGLAEDATEETALNAITTLKTDLATAMNRAETPSLDKFVPRADYNQAVARATNAETALAAVKTEKLEDEITAEIGAALEAGKITPATKDYHTARCREEGGLEAFRKFVEVAPVIGDPSGLDEKKREDKQGTALNAEEMKILENMGISVEDYQKTSAL